MHASVEAFDWQRVDTNGSGKADLKPLGTFPDGIVATNLIRLDNGSLSLALRRVIQLFFFCKGRERLADTNAVNSRALPLDPWEEAVIDTGPEEAEMIQFVLPSFEN